MDRDQYIKQVQELFASEFAFYLKTANFHWNVEGPNFYEYHLLFERIYLEVLESIDLFAEELRALKSYVPASFNILNELSMVSGQDSVPNTLGMALELLADSDMLAEQFTKAFTLAEQMGDVGLSNFLADRQDQHKKHSWMLRSTTR